MLAGQSNASSAARRLPNREAALESLYGDISAKNMFPFWATSTDVAHDEIKQLMGTQKAVPHVWSYKDDIEPILFRAAELVTMDDSERRSLILVNPGLSPRRATVSTMYTAYRLNDPNEVMPPHRHSPSAIRFGLTGKGNFTGVGGEDITFGPGDMVLTPARHLAQPRQRRQRAGGQSFRARPAAGRDAQCGLFRARLYRDGRRQAGQEEAADRDRSDRLLRSRLRSRRAAAALPLAPSRRRDLLADVCLSLGDDAGADRAIQGLGRRSLRGAVDRIRRSADRRAGVQDHDLLRSDAASGREDAPGAADREPAGRARSKGRATRSSTASVSTGSRFDNLAVPGGSWFEHVNGDDKNPAILFVASDEPALKCFHLFKKWGRDRAGDIVKLA